MQNHKKGPFFNVEENVLKGLIALMWRGPETGAEEVWPAPFDVVHNPAGLWPATVNF